MTSIQKTNLNYMYYKCRGYPDTVIASTRQKAASLDRDTLPAHWSLTNDNGPRTNTDDFHVSITYSPANPDGLFGIAPKTWKLFIIKKNLMIGHRHNSNVRGILDRAMIILFIYVWGCLT